MSGAPRAAEKLLPEIWAPSSVASPRPCTGRPRQTLPLLAVSCLSEPQRKAQWPHGAAPGATLSMVPIAACCMLSPDRVALQLSSHLAGPPLHLGLPLSSDPDSPASGPCSRG